MAGLNFIIDASEPESRQLTISLELPTGMAAANGGDLLLFLPSWTPGSYLIRDYSRHLGRVTARDLATGDPVPCRKVSKNRFALQVSPSSARLRVSYSVYAHDLSVRTADLTAEHAYWNHACVLLWPVGMPALSATIRVRMPRGWDVACSLPQESDPRSASTPNSTNSAEVTLFANDLDHAVDSPCLLGKFTRLDWSVQDVPHSIVLDGLGSVRPPATLVEDFAAIVRAAAAVWGGTLPYKRYLFLCLFAADGHGGLEHSDSTTLLMARTALRSDKGYREFLSLAAHELFHAWNVKRLRPQEFWVYDYENENHTTLLWLIEGWTAYYDDLLCLRAGLTSPEEYLAVVGRSLAAMRSAPGRFRLSLAESSFDAWIRLYRPDENSRNSAQNYYVNGSIAALCLDLLIRRESAATKSLDDVLRDLYRTTFMAGRGYTVADVHEAVARAVGPTGPAALKGWTEASLDPELTELLGAFGVRLTAKDADRPHLGITFDAGKTSIASLQVDAPAHRGGLSPGDEILAIQDLRVDSERWQDVFQAVAAVGTPLEVLLSRRGVICRRNVVPGAGPGTPVLELDAKAGPDQVRLRDGWLNHPRKSSKPAV